MGVVKWLISKFAKPTRPVDLGREWEETQRALLATRTPRVKRRGRTPEQIAEDEKAFAEALRRKGEISFNLMRYRATRAGATKYIWRAANDSDVCPICAARNGKKFRFADEPKHGHAGACTACPQGWCRCYPEPILP